MNSPGHRANILNQSYKHMGVGYKDSTWGQAFGSLLEGGPAIPVPPISSISATGHTAISANSSHNIGNTTYNIRYKHFFYQ